MPFTSPNTEHPASSALRPKFFPLHLLQANRMGGITEALRFGRPRIPTHPIDNVEAHVVADRDDGIFVEAYAHDDGKYRVHITIADVAGHVPLQSSLAQAAFARGFTVYGPGWTDSMFPKSLEEKLSLEHQQERLGFTISIDLDAQFKPVHTEFKPVITRAESMSYAQAAERMGTDPQLQKMAQIAAGIRKYYFSRDKNARHLQDGFSGRDLSVSFSSSLLSATEMVATYMLLANCCTAEFFNQSDLPYLYRNFAEGDDNARAYYHVHCEGHDAICRDIGSHGAYGHFTSPIRRAADLLNSYMAHYVFDTLMTAEDCIISSGGHTDRAVVHTTIWAHGSEIMRACLPSSDSQSRRTHAQNAESIILTLLENKREFKKPSLQQIAKTVVAKIQQIPLPLSHAELEQYAAHLNELVHAPETRATNKKAEDYRVLETLEKDTLATKGKEAFSALLHRAAMSGEMPRSLYNEALARIEAGKHENSRDGFSILVLAAYPHIPRWNMLKRAIMRRIKHDPIAVNTIIEQSRAFFGDELLQERSMVLPKRPNIALPIRDVISVSAAILTLKQKDSAATVAAPFYSVGHNTRAAVSHARYAFLEHYAFGELQPLEQTALPNVLYAELAASEKSRRALVEKMTSQAGGKLEVHQQITSSGAQVRLNVAGGKFSLPVVVEADAETAADAERIAFRRLLRDPQFKYTVAPVLHVGSILNPQDVLRDLAQAEGYLLEFSPATPQSTGGFLTEIILTSQEMTTTYCGTGPNKDRALRSATVVALNALGSPVGKEAGLSKNARSWSTDNDDALLTAQSRPHSKKLRKPGCAETTGPA